MSAEMIVQEPGTELQLQRAQIDRPIDVDAKVAQRKAFHEFVGRVLKDGVHYGHVRGIDKAFLWQPGAEEIMSAFGCRPEYSVVREAIDPASGKAYVWQKCRAVNVATGLVAGEGEGVSSNDEFEKGAGSKQPFSKILHNVVMRANKRAFVAAARALGCASEMFTQDEEMVTSTTPGGIPAPPDTKPGDVWGDAAQWHIHCQVHGRSYAREWDRGASIKCNRKDQAGQYCSYKVPAPTQTAAAPVAAPQSDAESAGEYVPEPAAGVSREQAIAAMRVIRDRAEEQFVTCSNKAELEAFARRALGRQPGTQVTASDWAAIAALPSDHERWAVAARP